MLSRHIPHRSLTFWRRPNESDEVIDCMLGLIRRAKKMELISEVGPLIEDVGVDGRSSTAPAYPKFLIATGA